MSGARFSRPLPGWKLGLIPVIDATPADQQVDRKTYNLRIKVGLLYCGLVVGVVPGGGASELDCTTASVICRLDEANYYRHLLGLRRFAFLGNPSVSFTDGQVKLRV
jgi:hypothetical protein